MCSVHASVLPEYEFWNIKRNIMKIQKLIDKDQRMWKPSRSKEWIKNKDESCESNTISFKMLQLLSYIISSSIFNSTLHNIFKGVFIWEPKSLQNEISIFVRVSSSSSSLG